MSRLIEQALGKVVVAGRVTVKVKKGFPITIIRKDTDSYQIAQGATIRRGNLLDAGLALRNQFDNLEAIA